MAQYSSIMAVLAQYSSKWLYLAQYGSIMAQYGPNGTNSGLTASVFKGGPLIIPRVWYHHPPYPYPVPIPHTPWHHHIPTTRVPTTMHTPHPPLPCSEVGAVWRT